MKLDKDKLITLLVILSITYPVIVALLNCDIEFTRFILTVNSIALLISVLVIQQENNLLDNVLNLCKEYELISTELSKKVVKQGKEIQKLNNKKGEQNGKGN